MTEETRLRRKAYKKAWNERNRGHMNAYNRAWRKANPEQYKAQMAKVPIEMRRKYGREYGRRNRAKCTARAMRWWNANPEKAKAIMKRGWQKTKADPERLAKRRDYSRRYFLHYNRKQSSEVSSHYAKSLLSQQSSFERIPMSAWPADLVELKRAVIQLHRITKQTYASTEEHQRTP